MGSHRAQGSALIRSRNASASPATPTAAAAEPGDLTGIGRHRVARAQAQHARPTTAVWPSNLPRAGVVGALGVATIVAPIVGADVSGESAADTATTAVAAPAAPVEAALPQNAPPLSTAGPVPQVAADFRILPGTVPAGVAAPSVAAAPVVTVAGQPIPVDELTALRATAEQASRAQERAVLPSCSGTAPAEQPPNGQIDSDELCLLWDGEQMLRADAAVALARLNAEYFVEFGTDMCITDSYRSYSEQVAVRRQKPRLAARPGTSQHGWGLAIDVCDMQGYGGGTYAWLRDTAPEFGWDNPEWARSGGSGPNEPWHWEYEAGQVADDAVAQDS